MIFQFEIIWRVFDLTELLKVPDKIVLLSQFNYKAIYSYYYETKCTIEIQSRALLFRTGLREKIYLSFLSASPKNFCCLIYRPKPRDVLKKSSTLFCLKFWKRFMFCFFPRKNSTFSNQSWNLSLTHFLSVISVLCGVQQRVIEGITCHV